jgi:hypothetical protein
MSPAEDQPTNDFFEAYIRRYGRAFDEYDLETIMAYYHTPCFIFKGGRLYANVTEAVKRNYFQDLLESYRREGYAAAEIPEMEIKPLGQESVLLTVRWVCHRADGSLAFDFWDSYFLIYINGEWKMLGDTVFEV